MQDISLNLRNCKNTGNSLNDIKLAFNKSKSSILTNKDTKSKNFTSDFGKEFGMGAVDIADGLANNKFTSTPPTPHTIPSSDTTPVAPLPEIKPITPPLGENMEEEKIRFIETIRYAKNYNEDDRTKAVLGGIQGRFSHANFTYGSDKNSDGALEFWSPPSHIISDNGKNIDCDDFAAMAKFWGEAAREQGYIPPDGRFEVVCGDVPAGGHAICVYFDPNGESYALDGTRFLKAGSEAWNSGKSQTLIPFNDYIETCKFELGIRPVSTFENYNALNITYKNPGNAFFDLQKNIEVINESGETQIIEAGTHCAANVTPDFKTLTNTWSLVFADGRELKVSENQVPALLNDLSGVNGSLVTNINGDYFSTKPYTTWHSLPENHTEIQKTLEPYSPEHIADLYETPELLAIEVVGAAAEALIPAVMAMKKWNTVKKRHEAANAVESVLKKWVETPNWEHNKGKTFTLNDMRDALKIAFILEVQPKEGKNKLKNVIELLAQNGELYNKEPYTQCLDFLKKIDQAIGKNQFSSRKLNSVDDVKALNRDLHALGIHAKYNTSKSFGRGEITSISPKVRKLRTLLTKLREAENNPERNDFQELLTNNKQELEGFASLRDYAKWKTNHHREVAIIFSIGATIGILPDFGFSDLIKSTAYGVQLRYQQSKRKITTKNIRNTLDFVLDNKNNIPTEQYDKIIHNLTSLQKVKFARSEIKGNRDTVNIATHTISAIATTPAYLGGPIGVTARRATKGAAKVSNAIVAASRLAIDAKTREKNNEDSSVITVYKDIKTLHETSPELANKMVKQLFDLNEKQFEILCKTTMVERKKVKLSTSACE